MGSENKQNKVYLSGLDPVPTSVLSAGGLNHLLAPHLAKFNCLVPSSINEHLANAEQQSWGLAGIKTLKTSVSGQLLHFLVRSLRDGCVLVTGL